MKTSRPILIAIAVLAASPIVTAAAEPLLPGSAKPPMEPFVCEENRDLEIRDRSIRSTADGVVASGNCSLRIVDSHILAAGVGVRADGNADVQIVDSFVQGRVAAVYADGNADVSYRDSTLRGGVGAEGNAELNDAGGNLLERIPGAADGALRPGLPIACGARDRLTVVHRYVDTEGDGITLEGDCELLLSDSHVRAGGAAVRVVGEGSVRIRNSTIEGDGHAVRINASGTVTVAGSNLAGPIDGGIGRYLDQGGNSRGAGGAATAGEPAPGTTRVRLPGTGIKVGPGGIEVRDGTGTVRVGAGGVVIEGRDDGGAGESRAETAPSEPVRSCADLCERWPTLTTSRQDCVAVVARFLDYPIDETPDCWSVETEAQCLACWRAIRATDQACRTAHDRCLAR